MDALKGIGDWVKPSIDNAVADAAAMSGVKVIVMAAIVGLLVWGATRKD
jgi:hypothetical protein